MKPPQQVVQRRPYSLGPGSRGFSAIELTVTLSLILILGAIAVPMLMRTLRIYQLNDSATQLAGILKLTRFQAIRSNTEVDCKFQPTLAGWTVWSAFANGAAGSQQTQLALGGYANLLPAGPPVPDPAPIAATLGGGGTLGLNTVSGATGLIRFDSRGAVDFQGAAWSVQVFYIGNAGDPTAGYRAVLVMPAGTTQIWRASAAGDWQRTS
jgi:prepilin-type N-terminal cleavage/methylation domain-containing protein